MRSRLEIVASVMAAAACLGASAGGAQGGAEVKTSTVGGYRVAYREAGEGPPVLLIHGLAASSVYWKETMEALARSHHVYALDLVGFGDSDQPRVDYSIEGHVEQIAGFMMAQNIQQADLVGHSLGGTVAALFAAEYPWKVRRLVLMDPGGLAPGRVGWIGRLSGTPVLGNLLMAFRTRALVRHVMRTRIFIHPDLATDDVVEPVMKASGRAYGMLFREVRAADIRPALRRLDVPTLVLWGEGDTLFPPSAGEEAARMIRNGRYVGIPDAGHIPQVENPAAVNRALSEFLNGS